MKNQADELSRNLKAIAQALDEAIEEIAGERVGFTLIVFTDPRGSYISTVNREDSVREIKKLLDYWGEGLPDIPAHKVN